MLKANMRRNAVIQCDPEQRAMGAVALASLLIMAIGTIISLWMVGRMTTALETLAAAEALDELDERLAEDERADLEGRIRENLFD